jgi:hypothetical protein
MITKPTLLSSKFFPTVGIDENTVRIKVEQVARDMEDKFNSRFPGKPDSPPTLLSAKESGRP